MKEIILKIDEVNRNGRVYTKECAEQIVEACKDKKIIGTLGFKDWTENYSVNYNDAAFVVEQANINGKSVFADIKVLETPKGSVLKNLLEQGVDLRFRTAGIGNVDTNEDGNNVVTDYKLLYIAAIPEDQDAFGEK